MRLLLATDPEKVAFNLYLTAGDGEPIKFIAESMTSGTNFADAREVVPHSNAYPVRPLIDDKEQPAENSVILPADVPARPCLWIMSAAWQNVGYNQPTQPGFYLGEGMPLRQGSSP